MSLYVFRSTKHLYSINRPGRLLEGALISNISKLDGRLLERGGGGGGLKRGWALIRGNTVLDVNVTTLTESMCRAMPGTCYYLSPTFRRFNAVNELWCFISFNVIENSIY